MRIGILGTGVVGQTLGASLAAGGRDVAIGTRDPQASLARTETPWPGMPTFSEWHESNPSVRVVPFAEAAELGEVVINATAGQVSVGVLQSAGPENLDGKILIDIANPLDFSAGFPPTLTVANTDSVGEQIQRTFPGTRVVKALNTVTAQVMVDPNAVGGGDHHIFVAGNDAAAKAEVARLLGEWFGWAEDHVIDLGDITAARGLEMYLALWVRLMRGRGSPMFNIKVVG